MTRPRSENAMEGFTRYCLGCHTPVAEGDRHCPGCARSFEGAGRYDLIVGPAPTAGLRRR